MRSATSGAIDAELEPGIESDGIEVTGGAVVVVDDSTATDSLVVVVVSFAPLLSHAVAPSARRARRATTPTVRGFSIAGRLMVDPVNHAERRVGPNPRFWTRREQHQRVRSASVGDTRAARMAGYRPAMAPISTAAVRPPTIAIVGMRTPHPWSDA
jgi:hypothetical protein